MTLSCVMSYNRLGDQRRVNPGAVMSASISWDSAAGTVLSSSSTDLPDDVGETLQVDVVQIATGTEIPSYNCTSWFTFSDGPRVKFKYALNRLSWTCVSAPVLTWCKYYNCMHLCEMFLFFQLFDRNQSFFGKPHFFWVISVVFIVVSQLA